MSSFAMTIIVALATATGTTIPDDFLNLYPNEPSTGGTGLGDTGIAVGPFVIGAVILIVIGMLTVGGRRRGPR